MNTALPARPETTTPRHAGIVLPPRRGKTVRVLDSQLTFKVDGADTGGAFSLWEATVQPQGGPPPHIHHWEDEAFYILEGEFSILLGDQTVRATAGEFVYLPRGVRHTFKNIGTAVGRFLGMAAPPGIEYFFEEMGQMPTDRPPDVETLVALAKKYGIQYC